MLKTRRAFSTEFKLDSAGLVLDKGHSIAEACEAVGTLCVAGSNNYKLSVGV